MRTFEIILIFENLLALILSFKKQSKAVWLGVAGANLSVFVIHGIFEGFRYQMAFSYVFVILLMVYALAKASGKFPEVRIPKALKVIAISLSFVLLALTFFLAYVLPVFTFPKPTGPYAVGIKYFDLVNKNRTDPFLAKSTQKRELMVKVYYPAKKDDSKPLSLYFHNSSNLLRLFSEGYRMPSFMFDHLKLVKTNSKDDLELTDGQQSYPVILFSHGAGMTMEILTSQSEDLASHGYIVVAIDHTYASVATVFPDRIVSAKEATTDFNTPEPAEIITQIMADDSKFVIEKLGELNEGKMDTIFRGRLNLDKIGVIGHSVGGAVAYNLAINDDRVKAAIDLDGIVFITPKEGSNDMAPFLMLANDKSHVQAIQNRKNLMGNPEDMPADQTYHETYNRAQQNIIGLAEVLKASGNLFTIEGSDHMKFIDAGLFIGVRKLRELIGISGKTDPAKCLEITEAVSLAFFDQHLKGETGNSLESLVTKYPALIKVEL